MNYDIIIIGAGLGGLTAGAKLAKEGRKVLLIEQHSKPGGCATTFQRGPYTMEVGLHEMDGPSERDMKSKIFRDLGVFDNIEFVKIPEFYRFINGRVDITIPHDPSAATAILKKSFPDDAEGIDAFFRHILNPKRKNPGIEPAEIKNAGEFLDSIIKNDDLKLVLLGNLGYFHDDPYSLSLAYYSIAQGSYFNGGASFIKGGSQKLSDHLARFIKDHGGEVVYNHRVTALITDNKKVSGVRYIKKKGSPAEEITSHASEIIANMAVPELAGLLPDGQGSLFRSRMGSLRPGASLLTIYFGFKSRLQKIGHNNYSMFVFDDSIAAPADILSNNHEDFSRRSFTFVDYGQIDSGLAPDDRSVGAVCCTDYLRDWESLNDVEYKARKEEAAAKFIKRLEKIIPGISREIDYHEVATAATVKRYTLNPEGAVYGFAQTPDRQEMDISDIFDNLHFASAWGKTGGGFSGAIYGGYLCAFNILRKRNTNPHA